MTALKVQYHSAHYTLLFKQIGLNIDATNGLTLSFWVNLNVSAPWDYVISSGGSGADSFTSACSASAGSHASVSYVRRSRRLRVLRPGASRLNRASTPDPSGPTSRLLHMIMPPRGGGIIVSRLEGC